MSERETIHHGSRSLALVAALLLFGAEAPAQRVDRYGDPLPEHAIARFGTLRFRGARGRLAFSPDGKLLASATGSEGNVLTIWDATTGRAIRDLMDTSILEAPSFSRDSKRLAYPTDSNHCRVIEVATGKELYTVAGFHKAFAEDGKTFITVDGYFKEDPQIRLWDAGTGQLVRQWPMPKGFAAWELSGDGQTLALLNHDKNYWVQICDLMTGAPAGSIRLPNGLNCFPALSTDGRRLALANRNGLGIWDATTGKYLGGCEHHAENKAVFSPDGRRVAWTGYDAKRNTRLWLMECDQTTPHAIGEPVYSFDPPCFSPNGKVLAVSAGPSVVRLHETATGKLLTPFDAHEGSVARVAFPPDGRCLVSQAYVRTFTWEIPTGRLLNRAIGDEPGGETCVALLPDGRRLTADQGANLFRLRDALTGRELSRFAGERDSSQYSALAAPGGRFAVVRGPDRDLCVLDLPTGECTYRVAGQVGQCLFALSANGDVLVTIPGLADGCELEVRHHATGKRFTLRTELLGFWTHGGTLLSPDGRWLLLPTNEGRLRRWDPGTGKELASLTGAPPRLWRCYWSPDGRLVGVQGTWLEPGNPHSKERGELCWWDAITGKRIRYLDMAGWKYAVCFSPDGRTLATVDEEGTIRLQEMATGRERLVLRGHLAASASALAFSADGRLLASGGTDSQVFLWDLTGRMPDGVWQEKPLDAAARQAAWRKLAENDATAAYAAQWQLLGDPQGTLLLFRDQLRPAPRPGPQQINDWITALESDAFAEREAAQRELAALGDRVAGDLTAALKQNPSAEARRRLKALQEALQGPPAARQLQYIRAVEVLEQLGTPEARDLLRKLAAVEAGQVGREARQARDRP